MRLITRFELAAKSKDQLYTLLREAFNELAKGHPDTIERSNALASLQNIENELASR